MLSTTIGSRERVSSTRAHLSVRLPSGVILAAWLLAQIACQGDQPIGPDRILPRPPASDFSALGASVSAFPACTHHWKLGVSGNFSDALRWNPGSVPGSSDVACIDASGTYTVTLSTNQLVNAVKVGNGTAAVTLLTPTVHAALSVTAGLQVTRNSTLTATPCGIDIVANAGGSVVVNGTLNMTYSNCAGPQSSTIVADTVINSGTINIDAFTTATITNGGAFTNSGTLSLDSNFTVRTVAHPLVNLAAGAVTGAGVLDVIPNSSSHGDLPRAEWNGGTLPAVVPLQWPTVRVRADTFVFGAPSLTGGILISKQPAETTLVRGNIGSAVDLFVIGCDQSLYRFERIGGAPTRNDGKVTLDAQNSSCPATSTTVTGPGFLNNGTLTITSHQTNAVSIQFDSLVNSGTTTLATSATFGGSGKLLRNTGFMQATGVSQLTVDAGSTLIAESGSTQTGKLLLNAASVYGTGTLGSVTSTGASVFPGAASGNTVGTLTASSIVLDAASKLNIDVTGAGSGAHDVLAVTTMVTYAGNLTVNTIAPFAGGVCGDVAPIITDAGGHSGAFGSFTGFQPSGTSNWRSYNPVHEYDLVAFNPSIPVDVVSSPIAVSEGGSGLSYPVCISRAPAASVIITPLSTLGQTTISPSLAIFQVTGWEAPKRFTVSAIDDAVVEAPMIDVVTHTVSSTDPTFNGVPTNNVSVTVGDNDGNADLALTITSGPSTVPLGTQFTASFDVSNTGPTISTGATFTIPLVAGFSYVSSIGATCGVQAGVGVTCAIPGIASGAKVSFSIVAKAKTLGAWPVTMSVSGQQPDPNSANNTKLKTVTVN
ncbi:MAG: DUF11 domain-containing protein [Gemmatimonadaceae bacterium]